MSLHAYTFPPGMANSSGREGPRGTGAGGWGLAPPGTRPWECGRSCNSFKRNWKSRSLSEISQVLKQWSDFSNLAVPTKQDSVPENQPWGRQLAASPQQTKFKSSKQETCGTWHGCLHRVWPTGGQGPLERDSLHSLVTSRSQKSSLL